MDTIKHNSKEKQTFIKKQKEKYKERKTFKELNFPLILASINPCHRTCISLNSSSEALHIFFGIFPNPDRCADLAK